MNISYNWLKQYINVDVSADEISKILTSIGLEVGAVEEVQTIKGGLEGLVVGKVLTCAAHENSDHLHVTTVDVGGESPLQIVCGAPNVAENQKVIVATVGTTLYAGEEKFTIKRSKIRGVESFGMICAEDEIGVGKSHDGIIVLPENVEVGTLAKDYYNIKNDTLIEVDITPNRIDAASHFGVARDLAAYFSFRNPNIKLSAPDVSNFKIDNISRPIPVKVVNVDACPRYSGVTISGVTVKESPEWLKNRLLTIGLRPINNVVDVTNFVLHELGQPLHAFDSDKIRGGVVEVKTLPEGTPFVTLDGVERKLSASDLMICNDEEPMCIAGVFGGINSGVTENTQNIFLESAYFNPVSVRKTARRHGLNTDASFRYERGCDPSKTVYILKRCALLIQEVAGGTISSEIIDEYPVEIQPFNVKLSLEKVNSLIGKEIGEETIETILKALEIEIQTKDEKQKTKEDKNNCPLSIIHYQLKVPQYRVDVQRDVDVIEDILRIYGYNNIEIGDSLRSTLNVSPKPDTYKLQNIVSEQLTAQGFNEILNNSLTREAYYFETKDERQKTKDDDDIFLKKNCIKLLNPLSSDLNVLRQTLLFGGLESIIRNINHKNADLKFYEFGNCYYYNAENKKEGENLSAYSEDFHLSLWLTGNKTAQSWVLAEEKTSVYQLKSYVENIFARLGVDLRSLIAEQTKNDIFEAAITLKTRHETPLAVYGMVAKPILKLFDIEQDVYYADLYWDNILATLKNNIKVAEIAKYPEVRRDLALLIDKNVTFSEIEKNAFETERKILKSVNLFDVYEGKNLEADKKSYAVSFILQDEEKTLNDKQIDAIMQKLQNAFETKLGAKLR